MKRAQAAMEFLMTYGWAILVVLAAMGIIAYLVPTGSLTGSFFLMPDRCIFPTGTDCIETPNIQLVDDTVTVVIRNGLYRDIKIPLNQDPVVTSGSGCDDWEPGIDAIVVNQSGGEQSWTGMDAGSTEVAVVDEGGTIVLTFTCADDIKKGRFKSVINFRYVSFDSGAEHIVVGEIAGVAH
ncbi:MAG: hypothetical protein ABIH34_07390 [Nanoarchaeota archaeon]